MTEEVAREEGVDVDMGGFQKEMEAQRARGRAAGQFTGDRAKIRVYEGLGVGDTRFLGYEHTRASSVVVGLLSEGEAVDRVEKGDEIELVLVETPFYPEGGGQVGDAGDLVGPEGKVRVIDTQEVMPGLIVHFGQVVEGHVVQGDSIDAIVDPVRRQDTARNHTATHMLHAALRQVLGSHVRQAGSLVAPDRLRFDFSHVEAMSPEEIESVEWLVNEKIRENSQVHHSEDSYRSAIDRGALAFFGDKYDDTVRLVEIANGATFSFEVCGGTHVHRTGELGGVYILGESSIGSGMRRIEAVSGRGGERTIRQRLNASDAAASALSTTIDELGGRIESLMEELDVARRDREVADRRLAASSAEGLLERRQDVDGVALVAAKVTAARVEALRDMGDWLRDKLGSGVVVLGSVVEERPMLIAMVTSDLVADGLDASKIARGAAKAIQGGGGGRPDVAQAGGRNAEGLDEALRLVPGLLQRKGDAP
jgi:alanyl-tRNA synthetase